MGEVIRIGLDTSKNVFQLHGVDGSEAPVLRRRLRRRDVVPFFAGLAPCTVGLEACGGSHHWGRLLRDLGHEVKILPPQYVKPYVKRNKNDAADAEAICEAMSRPTMRFVAVKEPAAQAAQMLVVNRDRLVRQRTQLSNAIRGFAAEFGHVVGRGLDKLPALFAQLEADPAVPALARATFAEMAAEYAALAARLAAAEARLMAWHRQDAASRRLTTVPGVGPIGAMLLSIKAPDPRGFPSGRDFAAWIGLTPRDHSTAGRTRLGVITRAGDEDLRAVLVSGATAVIQQVRRGRGNPSPWLADLLRRKEPKEAAVALANKMARVAWKLMVTGECFDPARHWAHAAPGDAGQGGRRTPKPAPARAA